jgi:hypothetical protein
MMRIIFNVIHAQEMIHKNTQATTVLLASLCRDEYNKVNGLDNAKKIWDTLKISHDDPLAMFEFLYADTIVD